MDDLRSEIRAAFDKEQASNPPAAGLRLQILETVAMHPRRATNLQWVAAVMAVLLGLAIVAGLMSSRLAVRAPTPVNPQGDYGPPPAGVQLVYVHDPNHPSWLIGYDWTGHARATVKLGQFLPTSESVIMAPDGQQFEVRETANLELGAFLDRLGQPVPGATIAYVGNAAIWADDNRHLCGALFDSTTGEWSLLTQVRGEAPSEGFLIAKYPAGDRSSIRVAACSFRTDVAILVRTTQSGVSDVWVMRLSDGSAIGHQFFAAGTVANIVASNDAAYAVVMPGPGTKTVSIFDTHVVRVSDWKVIATPRVSTVWGFSGDGSLLLVTAPSLSGVQLETLDWRSGRTVWSEDGPYWPFSVVARPGGGDFALGLGAFPIIRPPCLANANCPAPDPTRIVEIVHGDGSSTVLPRRYILAW